jgi:hypothetical protein
MNADRAVKEAENLAVGFKKPEYVPAGYEFTYLTEGTSQSINYDYEYQNNPQKKLNIFVSRTELTSETIYEQLVKEKGGSYSEKSINGVSYWFVSDNSLYFVSNNLLYEIVSSDKMPAEELLKIADGLL